MKKHFILTVLFITLSFLLTGCGHASAPEVNTTQLQNETGDFQYGNIPWGMDKASTENALGISFDQGTITTASTIQLCLAKDAYTLLKQPATVFCEFDASGLCSISFRITPAETDAQTYWDVLTSALFTQYGNVDPICTDSSSLSNQTILPDIQTESYLWEHSDVIHTALCVRKTTRSGKTSFIEVMVYVIPADRTQ